MRSNNGYSLKFTGQELCTSRALGRMTRSNSTWPWGENPPTLLWGQKASEIPLRSHSPPLSPPAGPPKLTLRSHPPPWRNSPKCGQRLDLAVLLEESDGGMLTTVIAPSGVVFPNIFFKNEFILLQNRLKLKKNILIRRGRSNGGCPALL